MSTKDLIPFQAGPDPRRSPGKPKGARNQAGLQRKIIALFNKLATVKGEPLIKNGEQVTNLDMVMELGIKDARYQRLLMMMFEYAYGKVAQPVDVTSAGGALQTAVINVYIPANGRDDK